MLPFVLFFFFFPKWVWSSCHLSLYMSVAQTSSLGGGGGRVCLTRVMSLILFAWDTRWVNLVGLSPGIDARTRGGSLCCCTCVVWRSVCFSDYKNPSMSFHYKPTPLIMECASTRSPSRLPQPRSSLECSPDIWDPSPTPPPLPASTPNLTVLHFEMIWFACRVPLVWCERLVVTSEFVPGSEHSLMVLPESQLRALLGGG